MKVGFVVYNEYPGIISTGGIGVIVNNIAKGLQKNRIQCEIFLITDHEQKSHYCIMEDLRINFIYIRNRGGLVGQCKYLIKLHARIEQLLQERGVNIVELSTSDSFFFRPYKGITIIARTHGSISYALKNYIKNTGLFEKYKRLLFEKLLIHYARKVICVSNQYYFHYRYLGDKRVLLENFVGDEFDTINVTNSNSEQKYVFFHGTLKDIKGIYELISAFKKSRYFSTHKLFLAGKCSDKQLYQLIYSSENKIVYLGELTADELKIYLNNADLAIYPSKRDAFNLAVAEAMSQKCKILVSDAIDPTIIINGKNGIVFPLNRIEALESYLDYCYYYDNWPELQNRAYKDFSQKYSFSRGIERNVLFYSKDL